MLSKTLEALRRADRSVGGAAALAIILAAVAGAIVPSTDNLKPQSAVASVAKTPLPLTLVAEEPVDAIMNPASLVLRTAPVEISPLLQELVVIRMLAEERCLAEAMYYEARGEGIEGEKAIAEVVFHRMRTPGYPRSICGVVYERAAPGHGCQFSFTCNGEMHEAKASGSWWRAKRLAARIVNGLIQLGNETDDAISFHAVDVQPGWGDHLVRTIQIGNHIFYKPSRLATRSS
jgi:spore germination cell wall hydrolase CwlJ-like protein